MTDTRYANVWPCYGFVRRVHYVDEKVVPCESMYDTVWMFYDTLLSNATIRLVLSWEVTLDYIKYSTSYERSAISISKTLKWNSKHVAQHTSDSAISLPSWFRKYNSRKYIAEILKSA